MTDGSIAADGARTDASLPPTDAGGGGANDATESGALADGGYVDAALLDGNPVDTADVATGSDASDWGSASSDGSAEASSDAPRPPDADATAPDADSGTRDVVDSGPTAPQILPQHGMAIAKPDAGGPFDSRCASDEVVTGFIGRAGVQTDAIASTCTKLIGGVLSSARNLPLNLS
jgi:hypothetical protein